MRGRISHVGQTAEAISSVNWFFLFTSFIGLIIAINSSLKIDQLIRRYR